MGTCVGRSYLQRFPAGADYDICGQRRSSGSWCRGRQPQRCSCRQHGPGIRSSRRRVGPCDSGPRCPLHNNSRSIRSSLNNRRAFHILQHRCMCGNFPVHIPDYTQRIRLCRSAASDRRYLPVRFFGRYQYDRVLGNAGIPEGCRHETERKLRHTPR